MCSLPSNVVVFCVQSQWLVAVQLGAGEDLPADGWNLQMRPGVPTHPPQGDFVFFGFFVLIHLKVSSRGKDLTAASRRWRSKSANEIKNLLSKQTD